MVRVIKPITTFGKDNYLSICSEGPHKTCYNCGYRQVDNGDAEPLPDEDQSYFCGDTTAPDVR